MEGIPSSLVPRLAHTLFLILHVGTIWAHTETIRSHVPKKARYMRHHTIRDSLAAFARKAGACSEIEQCVSTLNVKEGKSYNEETIIADIRVQGKLGHPPHWVDVVATHPWLWSSVDHKFKSCAVGKAVAYHQNATFRKYHEVISKTFPFAIDTFGRIADEGHSFTRLLASIAATNHKSSFAKFKRHLLTEIVCLNGKWGGSDVLPMCSVPRTRHVHFHRHGVR